MWTQDTMPFGESLIVSGLGIAIVFCALVALAITIVIVTKVFELTGIGHAKKATVAKPAAPVETFDEESYAVLISVMCEEMKLPPDKFKIVEIKEV